MPKLAHLADKLQKPTSNALEGVLGQIARAAVNDISKGLDASFSRTNGDLAAAQATLERMEPAIQSAIADAVDGLKPELAKIVKELARKPNDHKDVLAIQDRIVRALSSVRIPDYSDQLRRLEAKAPDLGPVLDKLDNLNIEIPEGEARPLKWRFEVVRGSNGLIREVIAEAE